MAKRFYHNITKEKFNLTIEELGESYEFRDKIMFTESGNAIINEPDEDMKKDFTDEMLSSFSAIIKPELL